MASKDNQTSQIVAIIGFAVGVLSLGLAALLYSSYSNTYKDLVAAKKDAQDKQTALSSAESDLSEVKKRFGVDGPSDLQGLVNKLDALAKEAKIGGDGLQDVTLVSVAETLLKEKAELERRNEQLGKDYEQLTQSRQTDKGDYDKNLATAREQFEQAAKELETLRAQFTEDRQKLNTEKDSLVAELEQLKASSAGERDALKTEVDQLRKSTVELTAQRNQLRADKELTERDNFDVADGMLLDVSHVTKSVYINLGFADALPSQATFSVYEEGSENQESAEPKGVIQVKKIIDDHLAECRIIRESKSHPMVSRDLIFSATWQPGRKETFGITGYIDMDGDGAEDLDRLIDLIRVNGGDVDAVVRSDGTSPPGMPVSGMSIRTKYLITGSEPTSVQGASAEYSTAHSEIVSQARDLGVKQVALRKFLDKMGYRPERKGVLPRRRELPQLVAPPAESEPAADSLSSSDEAAAEARRYRRLAR